MNLETMQREGREGFGKLAYSEDFEALLDQHTADTWKACIDTILESGLLDEKGNRAGKYGMCKERTIGHNTLARAVTEFISKMKSV